MEFKKIGLSLGGGGGKGAYQIGVLKAIKKFGYDKDIVIVQGTSIGALNIAVFATDLHKGEQLWDNLNRADILTKNKHINLKNFAIYSREGMEKVISDNIDLEAVSRLKTPQMYVTATDVEDDTKKLFRLNGKTPEEIMLYLKASSAIPKVFEETLIDGKYYVDGGFKENVPLELLVKEKCDLIFSIPVMGMHLPDDSMYESTTIISFMLKEYEEVEVWNGMMGFDGDLAKERIKAGYQVGKDMLRYLVGIGLLEQRDPAMKIKKIKHDGEYKKHYYVGDLAKYKDDESKKLPFGTRIANKILNKIIN